VSKSAKEATTISFEERGVQPNPNLIIVSLRSDSTSFTWLSSSVTSRFPVLEEPFAENPVLPEILAIEASLHTWIGPCWK
jgi:hypothetical protein